MKHEGRVSFCVRDFDAEATQIEDSARLRSAINRRVGGVRRVWCVRRAVREQRPERSSRQMQAIAPDISRKLANMSFFCSILVVLIHIQRPAGCDFWLIKWGSQGVAQLAVPFFFAMSGYVLLNHYTPANTEWWRMAIRKRVRTLVVPFFCLNIFWWPILYSFHAVGVRYFQADATNRIMDITILNFLKGINILPVLSAPVLGVLWYVRALLLLVLAAPILLWPLVRSRRMGATMIVIIYVAWILQSCFLPWMSGELSLRCAFFFSSGMFIRLYGHEKIGREIGIGCLLTGIALMLATTCCEFSPHARAIFGSLFTIFLVIGFWSIMPTAELPSLLNGKSFAIYVLHPMLIYLGGTAFKALGWWEAANTDIGILVSAVAYVVLACGIAEFMKRKTPKLSLLFFGGR